MEPIAASLPPSSVGQVTPVTSPAGTQATSPTSGAEAASATVDTIPSNPPDEVLDAVGAASRAYDSLAAQNKHVGFQLVGNPPKVHVQITDLQGNVISPSLAPGGVFDILDQEGQ